MIKDSKQSYQSAANGSIDTVNTSRIQAKLKAKGVTTLKRVTLKKQTSAASQQTNGSMLTPYSDGYKRQQSSEASYMATAGKALNFKRGALQPQSSAKKSVLLRDTAFNLAAQSSQAELGSTDKVSKISAGDSNQRKEPSLHEYYKGSEIKDYSARVQASKGALNLSDSKAAKAA